MRTMTGAAARWASWTVAAAILSTPAMAELPARDEGIGRSMREMFKGVAVDRCKDVGGPPVAAATGPPIARLSVAEGRPGQVVTVVPATAAGSAQPDEIRFLLKGRDIKAAANPDGAGGLRAIVPDFGLKGPSKGWVYLVRAGATGKAISFLFRERDAGAPLPK